MSTERNCNNKLTALSISVMLLWPAGCSNDNLPEQQTANGEPTRISVMTNLYNSEKPADTIKKIIEEKTNTVLDIQWVPDSNYDEKMNASFAAGTLPQAVYIKNHASFTQYRDAMRSGYFWEIGPLLKDYPNLNQLKRQVLENTSVDGKTYSIYSEVPLSRQGVIYRKDWADNLGIAAPKTIDDLYTMLKRFTENDPDRNGEKDTIGLADRSDLVFGAFKTVSSYFGTPNYWGMKDGRLMPEFTFPAYMDTLRYFKKLYSEGLINQDFPVISKTDQVNLFVTGKAGVYIGSMEDVQKISQKATAINPNAVLDVLNRIEGPRESGIWSLPGYISVVLFPKSSVKSEAELRGILAFFDKMMSPELANLASYGIEGTHYTVVEGKALVSDNRQLLEKEIIPFANLKMGDPGSINMLEPYFQLPVRAKAADLVKDNAKRAIHDPTAPLDSKTFAEKGARLQEIIKDATYQYILDMIDEAGFQKAVERWRQEGGDAIMEEYNADIHAHTNQ